MGLLIHLLLLLLAWTASVAAATVPQSPLPLTIVTPDVPPGGVAQVRIVLVQPRQIASGSIAMDFDPSVFGPVSAVDVFSANGDQIGVANLRDRHLDAQFRSPSGGIGRLPGMPAITVTVPVLATAKAGAQGSISFSAGEPWKDVQGYQYVVAPQTVQMKAGGSLSIDSVTPGGGLLPAGWVVRIAGHGFTASTAVEIGAVVVNSTAFISPGEIDVTLGAPADLTGKRVVAKNPDGTQADIYCALRGKFHTPTEGTQEQPIFPLLTGYGSYGSDGWPDAQNPNTEPIDLTYQVVTTRGFNRLPQERGVQLDPGEIATIPPTIIGIGQQVPPWELLASKPVRMLAFVDYYSPRSRVPVFAGFITPGLGFGWSGRKPSCAVDPFLGLTADPPCLVWLTGTPPPNPLLLAVSTAALATDFTLTTATADGGDWLSVAPLRGSTCVASLRCQPTKVTLTLDPTSLEPGKYAGTVTIIPGNPVYLPQTVTLLLHVANSLISVQGPGFLDFTTDAGGTVPDPIELQVTSSGDPLPFTASVRNPPTVFGDWLSVSPASGTTPATVTVTADPSALKYNDALNYITISGPANSVTRTVRLSRRPNPVLHTSAPGPLTFWMKAGTTTPATRLLTVSPFFPDTVTVTTDSGGNWLSASIAGGLSISVDPSGLDAGTYHGTITAASTAHSEYAPAQVVVNLGVWADSPPLSVSPASIVASVPSGTASSYYPDSQDSLPLIDVTSGDTPVESSVALTTDDGNDWLIAPSLPAPYLRYGSVFLAVDAQKLPPGTYHGTVKLTAPPESSSSTVVPVTLNVTPARPAVWRDAPPLAVSLVNGASQTAGPVAPGELVSVYGLSIGPGGRVLFDDLPADIVTASQIRVDAIVPGEMQGRDHGTVAVEHGGARTILGGMPVAAAAPAVFTADGSGVGQASATNEDDAANSAANPATRGSLIRIRATGAGTALPLGVKIQGTDATVASSVETNGVLELQVRVPSGIQPGAAVPVIFTAGSAHSQDGVTISVK